MNIALLSDELFELSAAAHGITIVPVPISGTSTLAFAEQVSSKAEVSALNAKITIDDKIFGVCEQTDLSIMKLSASDYEQLVADDLTLSNCLYIVETSCMDAYG